MKKVFKILVPIVIVIAVVVGVVLFLNNSKPKSNLPEITSGEDLVALVNKIYEGKTENLPMLDTQVLDFVNTPETAQYATDIEDFSNIEYAVASLPISSLSKCRQIVFICSLFLRKCSTGTGILIHLLCTPASDKYASFSQSYSSII